MNSNCASKNVDLKRISDTNLLSNTERLADQEREILSAILLHLKEIDRRKLFSALRYPSLFEYAKDRLKYSEDQAYRRITAMKLLREIPELEEKISSGAISLSHMNIAQGLFRSERLATKTGFTKEQKLDVMNKLENQPARQAQKIVLALSSSPSLFETDRIKPISEINIEVKFVTDELLEEKIKRLRVYSPISILI